MADMQVVPLGDHPGDQFISPTFETTAPRYQSDDEDDAPPPSMLDPRLASGHSANYRPNQQLVDSDVEHAEPEEDIEIRDDWAGSREFSADANDPAEHFKQRVIWIKAVLGEFLATSIFLYVIMANGVNFDRLNNDANATLVNPAVGGVCTAFVAVAVVYAFADVSGAHFNPCVTFATLVTRKTTPVKAVCYIVAQLLASIFATFLVWLTFPEYNDSEQFGVIRALVLKLGPQAQVGDALLMEFLMAFMLIYVIFAVAFDTIQPEVQVVNAAGQDTTRRKKLTIYSTSGKTKAGFAPIAIGFTLGFLAFIAGSVSGGAFNPARAFGPALLSWNWQHQWIYWFADFAGAALAGYTQMFFSARGKLFCSVLQPPPDKEHEI